MWTDDLSDEPARGEPRHLNSAGPEDLPSLEPMKPGRSSKRSWSKLRAQFQRFLQARLEQPWETTRHELLLTFGAAGVPPRILEQRLPDLVEQDVWREEGVLWCRDRSAIPSLLERQAAQHPRLYVCPETGLLRRFVREDTRNRLQTSEWSLVRQLGKRWYEISLAPLPTTTPRRGITEDVVLRCPVDAPSSTLVARLARLYGREGVYARDKRQVGKAELQRLRDELSPRG